MIKSLATFILFLCGISLSICQVYNFQYLDNKSFLPQSQAYAICFDLNEYAWIGTQGGGIAVYDGINSTYITQQNGLLSNRVYDLKCIDTLMYVACKGGVNIVNDRNVILKSIKFDNIDELAQSIGIDGNNIWIGSNKGLYRLTEDSLIETLSFEGKQVFSFFKENEEKFWACTNDGIIQVDQPLNRINKARGLRNDNVSSVAVYGTDWLIGTYGAGLWVYNKVSKIKRYTTNSILDKSIILNLLIQGDVIWIGTMNNGLFQLNLKSKSFTQFTTAEGLSNNHVKKLKEDRWGNLWIGTSGGGISIFNNSPFVSYNKSNGLNSNYIYSVLKDSKGSLWVGTQGLGVQKITDTSKTLINEDYGFKSVKTRAIFEDSEGGIWFGTEGEGIGYTNTHALNDSVILYKQSNGLRDSWVKCFTESKTNSKIYIGTANGIYKCSNIHNIHNINDDFKFSKYKGVLNSTRINDLKWHSKLKVLCFSSNMGCGIIRNNNVIFYESSVGFRNVAIKDSLLWFGSVDKGVLSIAYINDSTYKSSWINSDNFLLSNNIYQITEDFPYLWIGTEKGLTRFQTINKISKHFGYDEGFEGVETNVNASHKYRDGTLWFGTTDGLFVYGSGLEYDSLQSLPPKFAFEDIQIFYQSISETSYGKQFHNKQILNLEHTDNHIGFSIRAHHFTYQNKIRFRWKLEGADKNWSPPSKNNTATFSNLKPGNYRMLVQASIDNKWVEPPIDFIFLIKAPLWQQNWFIAAYVILAILIIAFVIFLLIKRQRNKNRAILEKVELEKSVLELEQKALRLQMNPHFIFNVLNSIHQLIILNDSSKARYALSKFSKLMRQVLENSRQKLVSIDEELETIENYVRLEKLTGQIEFDFSVHIDESIDTNELILPPLMLQPFIENAIIHGFKKIDRKGEIKLSFELENDKKLICLIEDNGGGRHAAAEQKAQKTQYHKSTALEVTQERLANLNNASDHNDFEISDVIGENNTVVGTKVMLKIVLP
ncbi:MAG: two-component regulator propeller domain-containing protein [Crocinitomicaceae bacterium]